MKLKLIRESSGIDCTFGVLFVDGYYQCFTLENTHKIIPAGIYPTAFYNSPKNKRVVPLLLNVPGRSEIEIHIANYFTELEGCIAVGLSFDSKSLYQSTNAFVALMNKIQSSKDLSIEIIGSLIKE